MYRDSSCLMALIASVLLASSGCERKPNFVPVEGTVTKNGQPQAGIDVIFLADPDSSTVGPQASGRTDQFGRYRLQTERGDDGVVVGTHRVVVLDYEFMKSQMVRQMREPTKEALQKSLKGAKRIEEEMKGTAESSLRVPTNFGSVNDTPLRAKVGNELTVYDIVIP